MNKNKLRNIFCLFSLIFLCFSVELAGGALTSLGVSDWYLQVKKPAWTPPNFLFGPVWTLLYVLMAVSCWLFWLSPSRRPKIGGYLLFFGQLLVNLAWSGFFFGLHSPLMGLIDIILLLILIIAMIFSFYRVDRIAAWLQVPYLVWTCYAAALNIAIVILNGVK